MMYNHVSFLLQADSILRYIRCNEEAARMCDDLNANIEKIDTRGPVSKYVLPDENLRGSMRISFDEAFPGIAYDLDSRGYHVLCKATELVVGYVTPYSITGSLPLVRDLQDEGAFICPRTTYKPLSLYFICNLQRKW